MYLTHIHVCICIYIYIYIHTVYVYIYIYILYTVYAYTYIICAGDHQGEPRLLVGWLDARSAHARGVREGPDNSMYIIRAYIYIERERDRERERYIHIFEKIMLIHLMIVTIIIR